MDLTKRTDIDPNWRDKYADMVASPAEAMTRINPGQRIFIGTACSEPQALVEALAERGRELADVELVQIHAITAPYAKKELTANLRVNSFFISDAVRGVIQEGLGNYTPIFLSDIPRLFLSGSLPVDVALIQVSPPDDQGYCSLGVSVDVVKAAAQNASLVIAQVNQQMPRVHGDASLHIFDVDVLVPVDMPLAEVPPEPIDETSKKIGEHLAGLIEDGATLEIGSGMVPSAALTCLKHKKNLGIHTETFNDHLIDLIEDGVVTGSEKTLDRGKIVASFCMGTSKLYEYIHDNPKFSFRPTEYVNDPFVIRQLDSMVAINTALQVDLTGQVSADSLGSKFFSGLGGQLDFNRGAARSKGGKAIIAMPSTADGGKVSRIVLTLAPGAGVVTTRGDVHYVVTEYGVAYLHGKNVQERALALITIAHPDFREELLSQAIELKYVRQELADVEGKIRVGPPDLRSTFVLPDNGTEVTFRPIKPTDYEGVKDLLYELSEQTIYYRFFTHMKRFPSKQIRDFVYIDNRRDVAIIATVPEVFGEQIVAVGRYFLDEKTNRAEVAFVVADKWQNLGIGTYLHKYLMRIAKGQGISGFTAEVLRENKAMQAVFNKSGCRVTSSLNGNCYSYEIDFE